MFDDDVYDDDDSSWAYDGDVLDVDDRPRCEADVDNGQGVCQWVLVAGKCGRHG